jgi:aspartyl/glutamyl-tRNA(Asn/Gln) amidotransferase C subunit
VSTISRADIQKIADLAELHVDEAAAAELAAQLHRILDYVEQLNELPQDGATEIPRPAARLRRDELAADALDRPPAEWAPAFTDGLFVVPRLGELDRDGDES